MVIFMTMMAAIKLSDSTYLPTFTLPPKSSSSQTTVHMKSWESMSSKPLSVEAFARCTGDQVF